MRFKLLTVIDRILYAMIQQFGTPLVWRKYKPTKLNAKQPVIWITLASRYEYRARCVTWLYSLAETTSLKSGLGTMISTSTTALAVGNDWLYITVHLLIFVYDLRLVHCLLTVGRVILWRIGNFGRIRPKFHKRLNNPHTAKCELSRWPTGESRYNAH